jgi:hypothetical protein
MKLPAWREAPNNIGPDVAIAIANDLKPVAALIL